MPSFNRHQATIEHPVEVSGFGFWSGRDVTVRFEPAAADTGIVFVRTDLPGHPAIPANILHRIQGPRRTTLVHDGCAIEMVEHALAALSGMGIDNCRVLIDAQEVPGVDGSSKPFVDALLNAGRQEQNAIRETIPVLEPIRVGDDQSWIQAEPVDHGSLELVYKLSYECPSIGQQTCSAFKSRETFVNEISPARTFLLKSEADALQEQGLGKRVTHTDVLVFDDAGPLDNSLRFTNECARHKLLDMIGDFALLGSDIIGKFTASKTGHFMNARMVLALREQIETAVPLRRSA